jgi:hypothetical protein
MMHACLQTFTLHARRRAKGSGEKIEPRGTAQALRMDSMGANDLGGVGGVDPTELPWPATPWPAMMNRGREPIVVNS